MDLPIVGERVSMDFSTLLLIFFVLVSLQPLLMGRWSATKRMQAIRAIEKSRGSRIITMIHRQENGAESWV